MALTKKQKGQLAQSILDSIGRGALDLESGVKKLRASGLSDAAIRQRLEIDFSEGGSITGPMFKSLEDAVVVSTGQAFSSSEMLAMAEEELPDLLNDSNQMPMSWVCALVATCSDCLPRHGQTATLEEWMAAGLPRSGFSACDKNCKCILIPTKPGDRNQLIDPLKRTKTELRKGKFKTARGLPVKIPPEVMKRTDEADREKLAKKAEKDIRLRRALALLGRSNS